MRIRQAAIPGPNDFDARTSKTKAMHLKPLMEMDSSSGMGQFCDRVFLIHYTTSFGNFTQIGIGDPALPGDAFVNQRFAVGGEGGDLALDAAGNAAYRRKLLLQEFEDFFLFANRGQRDWELADLRRVRA